MSDPDTSEQEEGVLVVSTADVCSQENSIYETVADCLFWGGAKPLCFPHLELYIYI